MRMSNLQLIVFFLEVLLWSLENTDQRLTCRTAYCSWRCQQIGAVVFRSFSGIKMPICLACNKVPPWFWTGRKTKALTKDHIMPSEKRYFHMLSTAWKTRRAVIPHYCSRLILESSLSLSIMFINCSYMPRRALLCASVCCNDLF